MNIPDASTFKNQTPIFVPKVVNFDTKLNIPLDLLEDIDEYKNKRIEAYFNDLVSLSAWVTDVFDSGPTFPVRSERIIKDTTAYCPYALDVITAQFNEKGYVFRFEYTREHDWTDNVDKRYAVMNIELVR